jgi:hypothetical protein
MSSGKRFTIDPKTHKPMQVILASSNGRCNGHHVSRAAELGRRIIVLPEATLQHDGILAARAVAPPPPRPWLNADVHARTPEMRAQLLAEYPDLPKLTRDRSVVPGEIERVISEMRGRVMIAEAVACIDKIYARRGAIDNDLCSVSVAGLLCVVWSDCVVPRITKTIDLFVATLCDMGTTCVQGDSHRLFAAYVAYKRDEIDCAKLAVKRFDTVPQYE